MIERRWEIEMNFRELNNSIESDKNPLPEIDQVICANLDINSTKIFSKIKVLDAYKQLRLEPKSRAKTAFKTGDFFFEFKKKTHLILSFFSIFLQISVISNFATIHRI